MTISVPEGRHPDRLDVDAELRGPEGRQPQVGAAVGSIAHHVVRRDLGLGDGVAPVLQGQELVAEQRRAGSGRRRPATKMSSVTMPWMSKARQPASQRDAPRARRRVRSRRATRCCGSRRAPRRPRRPRACCRRRGGAAQPSVASPSRAVTDDAARAGPRRARAAARRRPRRSPRRVRRPAAPPPRSATVTGRPSSRQTRRSPSR